MLLSEINLYDLTGTNPKFARTDRRFAVFAATQCIDLQEAAYPDSIKVYKLESNGTRTQLAKNDSTYGWSYTGTYAESCNDIQGKSEGIVRYNSAPYTLTTDTTFSSSKTYYQYDTSVENFVAYTVSSEEVGTIIPAALELYERITSTWNKTLVNKFFMTKTSAPATPYIISVDYQALKRDAASLERDDIGPSYSPGLMRSVIRKLDNLLVSRFTGDLSAMASDSTAFASLEEDLTGYNSENYILNEMHKINVPTNKYVIRPHAGSFYRHDLQIEYVPESGGASQILTLETGSGSGDYEVIGVNKAKTAISEPSSGVYEYIVFKKAFVGTVYVTYHAFGGEISIKDLESIRDLVYSLLESLSNKQLITANTLAKATVITNIIDRLDYLDHAISHYKCNLFTYKSTLDSDNWVNVAFIDRNAWSSDAGPNDNDIAHFEVSIDDYNYMLDVSLGFVANLDVSGYATDVALKLRQKIVAAPTYDEAGASYFEKRVAAKFRIITNAYASSANANTSKYENGVMLQMSLSTGSTTTFDVMITDKTAAKSPWTLISSTGIRPSAIYSTTFPNDAVWSSSLANCIISNAITILDNDYVVYDGSADIAGLDHLARYTKPSSYLYGNDYAEPEGLTDVEIISEPVVTIPLRLSANDVSFDNVKNVKFMFYDKLSGSYLVATTSELMIDNDTMRCSVLYYAEDLCSLECVFTTTTVGLTAYTGTNSLNNKRFALERISFA